MPRGRRRSSWRWEIHIWRGIFPRCRIISALFRLLRYPRSALLKRCLAKWKFMVTCRLQFLESPLAELERRNWQRKWPANSPMWVGGTVRNRFQTSTVVILAAAFLLFSGCSINVKKDSNSKNDDKNVDINTPFGGIHVSKGADVHD